MRDAGIPGEVIVADNGSTDGSPEIARRLGARLVPVPSRGYGSALMGGIDAAQSEFILMADADDSYDLRELPKFYGKLLEGFDLVQGCRLPSGGGTIAPEAMPFSHRWIGNPVFSFLARIWFQSPVRDVYCGMRAFTKPLYSRLAQRCTGMEFAVEMIIKASLMRIRIAEVPITLHKDGRRSHPPHLKTVRDGWRTLRFFLMCSPRWLFLLPGLAASLTGLAGLALGWAGASVLGATLDAHTMLFSSMFLVCGFQSAIFGLLAKTYAATEGILPRDPRLDAFYAVFNVERLLALGALAILGGLLFLANAVWWWVSLDFRHMPYAETMRVAIPGVTAVTLGIQTILAGFFASILLLSRKENTLAEPASPPDPAPFDSYAANYETLINNALTLAGDTMDYFCAARVDWLASWITAAGLPAPRRILDFGCGTGSAVPHLLRCFPGSTVLGIDVSRESMNRAKARLAGDSRASFLPLMEFQPAADFDLAFSAGVLHHIPPPQRQDAYATLRMALRPDGLAAVFENNPLNPGTLWVMSKIPFDRGAVTLLPWELAGGLSRHLGRVIKIQHLFFFPAFLKAFRPLEPLLAWLPLGAQFAVVVQKTA